MAVYMHEMINWGKRIGRVGPLWTHLIGDTAEELHTFAQSIGLKRSWYQAPPESSVPHYDIGTDRIFQLAITKGVVFCDRKTFVEHQRRIRTVSNNDPQTWLLTSPNS